jgi:succinyl-CoA synthetase beta subunit
MKLVEYQGKTLLSRAGIAVPPGDVASSPEEARRIAQEVGGPVVVKAQILAPGRGKRGAILMAQDAVAAERAAAELLGRSFGPERCDRVLVEKRLEIAQELYLSCLVDASARRLQLILTRHGGGDVEEVFREQPNAVVVEAVGAFERFLPWQGRTLAKRMGLEGKPIVGVGDAITRLVAFTRRNDCRLAEINPLVLTAEGKVVAADAVCNVDEDAHFRLSWMKDFGLGLEEERPRQPTPRELKAAEIDKVDYRGSVHYQDLDEFGDVGTVTVGSGFSITMLDVLGNYGLKPADFCDCSGSPPADKVYRSCEVVLSNPNIKAFLFVSGVMTQDLTVTAEGIIRAWRELKPSIPFLVKLAGNRDREAYRMMVEAGLPHVYPREAHVEDIVEDCVKLMQERGDR